MENNTAFDMIQLFLSHSKGKNPLADLHNYSDAMTISQVVKFFEKQGIAFTKTMIQNYIRVGVLPPPADKRFYNKDHMIMLFIIDSLKSVYALDEIKAVFSLLVGQDWDLENPVLQMTDVYGNFLAINKSIANDLEKNLPVMTSKAGDLSQDNGITAENKETANKFLFIMMLMNQSILCRQIVQSLIQK